MIKRNILSRNNFNYTIRGNRLVVTLKEKTYLSLNLQPVIDGKPIQFSELMEKETFFILYSGEHNYKAIIDVKDNNISYWIEDGTNSSNHILYFSKSFGNLVHMRTFSSDYDVYINSNDSAYAEVKSKVIPHYEQEHSKLKTWFLTPPQRTFSVKLKNLTEKEKPWFGFSLPGRLPVDITRLHLTKLNGCEIEFINYRTSNNNGKLPKVYLFDYLEKAESILEHHYNTTIIENACITEGRFYSWWNKPVLTPSSDFLAAMNDENFDYKTLLSHIEFIEEKTGVSDFNIIIDGYWFQKVGLYKGVNKRIFKEAYILKEFIDTLHKKNHKVILWMSQFRNDNYELQDVYRINENALFDYTKEDVRQYIKEILHYILSNDKECLNADGIKLDYGFLLSNNEPYEYYNPKWGVGDQYRSKVNEFIYQYAHELKPDVYISDITAEPSVALDIIRLNDDWGESTYSWIERGRKAISVKHAIIDTDGYLMFKEKFKKYSMIAPVMGVPNFYCVKDFFGSEPIEPETYRILSSSWKVYLNAPVTPDMEFYINSEENEYWRKYTNGILKDFYSAICINGHCLVTYSTNKALITSVKATVIEIPIPSNRKIIEVKGKKWDNTYENYSYWSTETNSIVLKLEDLPSSYQWVEISY